MPLRLILFLGMLLGAARPAARLARAFATHASPLHRAAPYCSRTPLAARAAVTSRWQQQHVRMMCTAETADMQSAVDAQGAVVRKLKDDGLTNGDPAVMEAVAELKRLKALLDPPAPAPPPPAKKAPKAKAANGKAAANAAAAEDGAEESMDDLMARRLEKAEQMRASGAEPYAYSFAATHLATQLAAQFAELPAGEVDDDADVAVSGRVLMKRVFGKLAFFTLQVSRAAGPRTRPVQTPRWAWVRVGRTRPARCSCTSRRSAWARASRSFSPSSTLATSWARADPSSAPTRASFRCTHAR